MQFIVSILVSALVAFWVSAIAILAVQNGTPVALRFLTYESIQMPVGVMLAFCVGLGAVGGAVIQLFLFGARNTFNRKDAEF